MTARTRPKLGTYCKVNGDAHIWEFRPDDTVKAGSVDLFATLTDLVVVIRAGCDSGSELLATSEPDPPDGVAEIILTGWEFENRIVPPTDFTDADDPVMTWVILDGAYGLGFPHGDATRHIEWKASVDGVPLTLGPARPMIFLSSAT